MIDIKVQVLSGGKPPFQKFKSDFAYDLFARDIEEIDNGNYKQISYSLGIRTEIPEGYGAIVTPRSSIFKKGLSLANSIGIIDSSYRGEWKAIFNVIDINNIYDVGDRVAQFFIIKKENLNLILSNELKESERGEGGFGSTGN